MNWRPWLTLLVILALAVPLLLYFGSLDWRRSHTQHVSALPILGPGDDRGEFRVQANDLEFRARVAGLQNDGDGVILLHGFPESSIAWTPLTEALAVAGYRVVAFDQRGYSPGARPPSVADYVATMLSADVIAVADAVGFDDFHLVGHDWGSAVGWVTVIQHPAHIRSWTGMAIPHIAAFVESLQSDPEQQSRSGYISILQRPLIAEFLLTHTGQRRLRKLLERLPDEHRNDYLAILAEPGALTAALNWYRALDIEQAAANNNLEIAVTTPTLFIWGNEDPVIARSTVELQQPYLAGPYREIELDAGHSLLREAPDHVITAILAHVDAYASKPTDDASEPD